MGTRPAPRRLVLVRHAEAGAAVVDADRRLTDRGEREAAALGRWLAGTGTVPDRVLVSPARRARQTWDRAAEALDGAPRPVVEERLYENTVDTALAAVRATAEDVGTLVVVGHNPSLGELAHVLDGQAGPGAGFPPGAVAVFELGVPFDELEPGVATFVDARTPGT
jgi:phosphohistidine phosphatase